MGIKLLGIMYGSKNYKIKIELQLIAALQVIVLAALLDQCYVHGCTHTNHNVNIYTVNTTLCTLRVPNIKVERLSQCTLAGEL